MRLPKPVAAAVALGCSALFLASCGPKDAPSCSSATVEELVAQLLVSSSPDGHMRWALPFHPAAHQYFVGFADIDVPAMAEAFHFQFANERERGYDKETRKRSCTADVSGSLDGSDLSGLITVTRSGLSFEQGRLPLGLTIGIEAENPSDAVVTRGLNGDNWEGAEAGAPVDFDDATLSALKAAFAGAMPKFVQDVRWHQPQDYTAQVTETGKVFVTINE